MNKMEVKLRKYRNNLVTSGWAIIVLCLWDNAKIIISLFLNTTYSQMYFDAFHVDVKLFVLEIVFTIIFMALVDFFHFLVGINAIKEGNGNKRRPGYLVVCVFLFIATASSVVISAKSIKDLSFDITLASILIDGTLAAALADLFISSVRIRVISKKTAEGGNR